jgi:ABC-type transport system involved in multi-copper enzyme maturation permease subunit
MSATVLAAPLPRAGAADRPGLGRLTLVELRKMTDTRAGFWLLLTTAGLTVLVAVIACLVFPDDESNLLNFLSITVQPASILMPIVGILLVTSEWSQRTAMVSFALVPQRSRVLVAKLLAGVTLSAIALVLGAVVALTATAVAGADGDQTWSLSGALLGQIAFSVVVAMLGGIAFGALLLASAPAIVLYFVLPTVWSGLGSISALEGAARWLDQSRTMSPLFEESLSSMQWARVATSLALWLALPLVVGFWRVTRGDVR